MILYDRKLATVYKEYGIMLPISPSRADRIVTFLEQNGALEQAPVKPVFDIPGALHILGDREPVITRADVERVHQREFVADLYEGSEGLEQALLNAWELIDCQGRPNRYEPDKKLKPLEGLFQNVLAQVQGTYLASRLALSGKEGRPGFCYYLGGGMHHSRYDHGTGFCLINDIVIAARKLQAENRAVLIWVIDVDAHKGCGTAELVRFARDRGELGYSPKGPDICNLSIHMASGWPLDPETLKTALPDRAPRIEADAEIPIPQAGEALYIEALEKGITLLETRSQNRSPDLVIVVDGADPYKDDELLSSSPLKLSLEQCLQRDRRIYEYLQKRRLPSVWLMAGGYGEHAWEPAAYFLKSLIKTAGKPYRKNPLGLGI
ncbi:MAG: histone deacetylase [Treponema sp.]|jgi:acetoin utilization deacetylase AcuC-like enzyme|nr:histone deacetylase [Treponema sp.]